ncbi:HNH endonuclease [Desulfonatronum lacustre]|uniref:HNH endonuclease n=1 Tax=Desulfonatronum lacustre TaxID=66849 RepID=UPI0012ECAA88|nr:HNH endonuclease [Desulfonatronum lacustre]
MKQLKLFGDNKEENVTETKKRVFNPYLGPKSPPMGYNKYIKSDEWKNKRIYALKAAGYKCQKCGITGRLEVHHLDYDSSLYHERLNDVEVLCRRCHQIADSEREYETAYESYAYKIYGDYWVEHDDERLREEFDEWYERKREDY